MRVSNRIISPSEIHRSSPKQKTTRGASATGTGASLVRSLDLRLTLGELLAAIGNECVKRPPSLETIWSTKMRAFDDRVFVALVLVNPRSLLLWQKWGYTPCRQTKLLVELRDNPCAGMNRSTYWREGNGKVPSCLRCSLKILTATTDAFCWNRLNGYLFQGNIPLRTSQFKHILKPLARERLGVPVGLSTRVAGADQMRRPLACRVGRLGR